MFAVDDVILPRHFPERAIKIVRDFTHEWRHMHRILLMVWVKYAYTTGKPGSWVYCLGLEGRSTEMETRSMYRTLSLVVAGPLKIILRLTWNWIIHTLYMTLADVTCCSYCCASYEQFACFRLFWSLLVEFRQQLLLKLLCEAKFAIWFRIYWL